MMKRSYQFHCKCCELNLILYKGIEEKYSKESTNFYCFNCHKISHHDQCADCGDKLYFAVKIPKEKRYSVLEEENPIELKLECMRCKSKDTELTLIGEWEN